MRDFLYRLPLRALWRGLVTGLLLAIGLHAAYVLGGSNFRTVIPGQVYRCRQPSPERLTRLVEQYGIRTVINLRGCCPGTAWYQQESETTADLDISQEDLSLSAGRLPSVETIRQLVEILDNAEYPILLHCHQGADRTGLAAVMALLLRTETPLDEALAQLSIKGGHLRMGRTRHIDRFFDLYQEWLDEREKEHDPEVFRLWAIKHYCPDVGSAEVVQLPGPPIKRWQHSSIRVRCKNTSLRSWELKPGPNAGIHGQYYVLDGTDRPMGFGRAGLYRATIHPGQCVEWTLALPPLPRGHYRVQLDILEPQHAGFGQLGCGPFYFGVEVP